MRAERALFEGLKSKEKDQKRRALHVLPAHSAGIECAHGCAPLYLGPLGRGGGMKESSKSGRQDAGQFFVRAGCPVEKPRNPSAHFAGTTPAKRALGVPFLWVTFLWARKEK